MPHDNSNDRLDERTPQHEAVTSEHPLRSSEDPTIVSGRIPTGIPKRIGSYHLKRLIGSGGMGSVYEAQQDQPRRRVALKIMKAGVTSKSAHRRFEAEAQLLARLRHTGIAQVYEAGTYEIESDSIPYFAMEYIANAKNLIEYARLKDLNTEERLELFTQVCEAVQHGHQKGIIHRDLKPDNILVDSSGQVKIIDFGVARATDADMVVTTLQTDVGQIIGTLQYMSPEQCEADPTDLDTRSDVYALGVVLYELLCQQLPYDLSRAAMYEAVRIIRETPPTHPSTINTRLRGDVETIALKALEKERDRRYQSAADLGKDIQRYLHSEPIEARRASVAYQLSMMARRNKPLFAAAAAIVIGLSVAAIGASWGWTSAETAKEQAIAAKNEAQEARDEAERQEAAAIKARNVAENRFEQVRAIARLFMFDFYDAIKQLDGSTQAKELLASSALEYLETLRNDAGDDPELLLELSDGYLRVGEVYGGPGGGHLGRFDEAITSHRAALDIRKRLAERSPDDRTLQFQLAKAHRMLGESMSLKEDWKSAMAEFLLSSEISEQLTSTDPDDAEAMREYGRVIQKIGDMHEKSNEPVLAKAMFDKALSVKQQLLDRKPNDPDALRDLSTALNRIASQEYKSGNYEKAYELFSESLTMRRQVHEEHPDGRSLRDVLVSEYFAGICAQANGDRNLARELLFPALESAQYRLEEDAINNRAKRDFLMICDAVGALGESATDAAFQLDCLEHVRKHLQSVHDVDPADAAILERLESVNGQIAARQARGE